MIECTFSFSFTYSPFNGLYCLALIYSCLTRGTFRCHPLLAKTRFQPDNPDIRKISITGGFRGSSEGRRFRAWGFREPSEGRRRLPSGPAISAGTRRNPWSRKNRSCFVAISRPPRWEGPPPVSFAAWDARMCSSRG